MKLFQLLVAAAVVAAPAFVRAEGALSLDQVQAEARAQAPEAAELAARIGGARAVASDARRVLRNDPLLTARYVTGALCGDAGETAWEVGAEWTIDISGSWAPRRGAAEADLDRATFDEADGLRMLDEAVAFAVADLSFGQRQVARLERIVALQELSAAAARKQLDAGQGTQLDVDSADLDWAAARQDLVIARGDREQARVRLARLVGRVSGTGVVVEDPIETKPLPARPDPAAMEGDDPRVRAAEADMRAARLGLELDERLVWPAPTFGVDLGLARHEIPTGAFTGDPVLNAKWRDTELGVRVTLPFPLVDRRKEQRTRSSLRLGNAEAHLRTVRADVWGERKGAWEALAAAAEAYQAVAGTAEIVDRDYDLLGKALRAGALDVVVRAQSLRRLEEAGVRLDRALRDLRVARARWARQAGATR